MKKLYSFFALLLTSLMVGAQTFTVTTGNLPAQSWWPTPINEQAIIIDCPQSTAELESKGVFKSSGSFIEGLAQANLGNIKKIIFDPSVSTVSLIDRTQMQTNLCANGVSIIANHPVTIICGTNTSYKALSLSGTNDTIMGLTFQDAYIELTGTSSYIANNTFNTNQAIGGIFLFNTSQNMITSNILTNGGNTNNSAIRLGTNQSETIWGNTSNDKIINNKVTGYWNGLEIGRWKSTSPNCNNLYIANNEFYINKNSGCYVIGSTSSLVENNYIYGNLGGGLFVEDCKFTNVYSNKIGFDKSNNLNGNKGNGININGGNNIRVGDFVKGGNVVVGSGNNTATLASNNGIAFQVSPTNNLLPINSSIKSNFVGVFNDGTGSIATGSKQSGIYFAELANNSTVLNDTVGGMISTDGNIVGYSGLIPLSQSSGIQINKNNNSIMVYNNYSGINRNGNAIPNDFDGIAVRGAINCDVWANKVGNNIQGIAFRPSNDGNVQCSFSKMRGNYCGTSNGIDVQRNSDCGLSIEWGSNNNTVGGLTAGDSNFVMNEVKGIWVAGNNASSNNNNILGNSIKNCTNAGVSVENNTQNLTIKNNLVTNTSDGNALIISGTVSNLSARSNHFINSKYLGAALQPTKGNGVYMTSGNTSIIGGTEVGEGNIITNNQTDGISLSGVATNNVMFRRNTISCNQGTGINLNGNANTNYMFDIIKVDTTDSNVNSITGQLKGITTKDVIIEVYGPGSSCKQSCSSAIGRQGYEYLGTTTSNAEGKWTLTLAAPILLSDVTQITATATTPSALNVAGSFVTSEFSRCNDALPVEFISFTAKSVQNGVALNWVTATETNNEYFLIERSSDGINFTSIGAPVEGAGTSNQTHVYKYLDFDPNEGINYYRIRQVDYDGKFDFSNVQVVNLTGAQMISVSPNPNNGHFGIKIISESSELFNISIYNALGQSIYTTSLNVYGGFAEHKVNLDKLSSGVYTLVIKNDVDTWTEKVIKE